MIRSNQESWSASPSSCPPSLDSGWPYQSIWQGWWSYGCGFWMIISTRLLETPLASLDSLWLESSLALSGFFIICIFCRVVKIIINTGQWTELLPSVWMVWSQDEDQNHINMIIISARSLFQHDHYFSTISSGLNSLAAIGLRDFLPTNTRSKMGESWQVQNEYNHDDDRTMNMIMQTHHGHD